MIAVTCGRPPRGEASRFQDFLSIRRPIAGLLAGLAVSCGIALSLAGNAAAADSEPKARKNPMLDEDRRHDLSVYSFMNELGDRRGETPVLVTLNVTGPRALTSFCEFQPRVNEAVLGVMMQGAPVRGDEKKMLAAIESPLKLAINDVLPGKPVRKVVTRSARNASEFGPDLLRTEKACKAVGG
jgi:hypothetical protein